MNRTSTHMKNYILIVCITIVSISCNGKANGSNQQTSETKIESIAEKSAINIYYFHGKQRCKTCVTVEKVAKETVESNYADNHEVRFIEVDTENKANKPLVEKYQIAWNALIIAKENDAIEITKQAFANAVNNPEVLTELIKTEVNKRLTE